MKVNNDNLANLTVIGLKNKQVIQEDQSQRPPFSSRMAQQKKQKSKQVPSALPNLDQTAPGNKMMVDCVQIKLYKNQVYDPMQKMFPALDPAPLEDQTNVIHQARELNPDLQNAQEAQRLLEQAEYFQSVYQEQLRLRKTVEGNSHRFKHYQQLKKTLESNQYFNLDKTEFGANFKREYLTLQDQQILSGVYKPLNGNSKTSSTSKYKRVGDFEVEESRIQKLPKVFKNKQQMYEAVSTQAVVKGMQLKIDMDKRKNAAQFITELKHPEE